MAQMAVYNMEGEKVGQVEAAEDIFSVPLHHDIIHQALVTVDRKRKQHAGQTKTRSEIVTSGAKIYRQKGLGRARHHNRSANLFVGGAKAHGPDGQPGRVSMPKKMRRQALWSVLSAQLADGRIIVVDEIELEEIRTKTMVEMLEALGCRGKILMLLSEDEYLDQYLYRSSRNIPKLVMREVPHFSVRDVLWADHIIITQAALGELSGGGE